MLSNQERSREFMWFGGVGAEVPYEVPAVVCKRRIWL